MVDSPNNICRYVTVCDSCTSCWCCIFNAMLYHLAITIQSAVSEYLSSLFTLSLSPSLDHVCCTRVRLKGCRCTSPRRKSRRTRAPRPPNSRIPLCGMREASVSPVGHLCEEGDHR